MNIDDGDDDDGWMGGGPGFVCFCLVFSVSLFFCACTVYKIMIFYLSHSGWKCPCRDDKVTVVVAAAACLGSSHKKTWDIQILRYPLIYLLCGCDSGARAGCPPTSGSALQSVCQSVLEQDVEPQVAPVCLYLSLWLKTSLSND